MKHLFILTIAAALGLSSCIDDSVTTDPAAQPLFSTDRLEMAPLLSGQSSPTYKLTVYNPGSRGITINNISVDNNDEDVFAVNVDGRSGSAFHDVTIRGGDSIFVFVEARIPEQGADRECRINFSTAGRNTAVVVAAPVIEATILHSPEITADQTWRGNYLIYGDAVVGRGATLDLEPSTNVYFADEASLTVDGALRAIGTAEQQIVFQGDRFDDIVPDVAYTFVAGQWKGIAVGEEASVRLEYASVLNAKTNLSLAPGADAELYNCRIHNAADKVLDVDGATLRAVGCELTDAALNVIRLADAQAEMTHCTISNHYILSYPVDPMIALEGDNVVDIANSIVYGLSAELSSEEPLESRPVFFRRCLFESTGFDDYNFIDCIWGEDPQLNIHRSDYILDYSPLETSPALGAADPSLTPSRWTADRYGTPVGTPAPVGAYAPAPLPGE